MGLWEASQQASRPPKVKRNAGGVRSVVPITVMLLIDGVRAVVKAVIIDGFNAS